MSAIGSATPLIAPALRQVDILDIGGVAALIVDVDAFPGGVG
ncbi:hypothetical protein [Streptomyces sp. NBC_00094]|nr:hypothetical protein [Streptomyces sp. NBC_00094]MCX5395058.1 hypothetical protein [Streptomyces sp. NBC_00094]